MNRNAPRLDLRWYSFYNNDLYTRLKYTQTIFIMEKIESKNNMTVVHLASRSSKPIAPSINNRLISNKVSDPSSCIRSDRYPIPTSFEYRFNPNSRDYVN